MRGVDHPRDQSLDDLSRLQRLRVAASLWVQPHRNGWNDKVHGGPPDAEIRARLADRDEPTVNLW